MINNIDCLYILYNILQMIDDRNYVYLGTNYEKIKLDFENYKNTENIKSISNYKYILTGSGKSSIICKEKNNYVLIVFFESFFNNDYNDYIKDINNAYKEFGKYITRKNPYWSKTTKVYIICPDVYEIQLIKKMSKDNFYKLCETIDYTNLLYNPTNHEYVSKHEKIKNYEKKYKKYNLKHPEILKNDAICKWYNYEINDILKVTRKDRTICYRIVKDEESYY